MEFNAVNSFQARALTDLRQIYEAWYSADRELRHHFSGSMRWKESGGAEYLLRKVGISETSLGRRSPETEHTYSRFIAGREAARERLAGLVNALDTQAAVARAIGLGRVPLLVARLLRALDDVSVLGHIRIVGTNALFAYEAMAGVHFSAEALATGDVDLLLDARQRLRIMVPDANERTVLGLLQRLDHSFAVMPGKPYRVANADGFMVDLIRPESRPPWKQPPGAKPLAPGDISPSPIEGLQWLVNSPSARALVVDERGYPAPIIVPEPRIWLLHKVWVSTRPVREPEKKRRDIQQAQAMWRLVEQNLPQYPLDAAFANGLPKPLREAFEVLRPPPTPEPNKEAANTWTPPRPRW